MRRKTDIASEPPLSRTQRPKDQSAAVLSSQLLAGRFIALGGPGGLGRPKLAITVAQSLVAYFGDAICLVDLGSVQNTAEVVPTIISALGCIVDPQDPLPGLAALLARRKMLLVLDCCEHVIETVASLTARLFKEAPLVHILATSNSGLLRVPARMSVD